MTGEGREEFLPRLNYCNHWKTKITSLVVCLAFRSFYSYFYVIPTPVFLPGESHGRRSLVGYSPWGLKESDTTE